MKPDGIGNIHDIGNIRAFYNSLEPAALIEAFECHPPVGFAPAGLSVNFTGSRILTVPAFKAELNLFTTMDENLRATVAKYEKNLPNFIKNMYRVKTLFVGTTVSEYAVFPKAPQKIDIDNTTEDSTMDAHIKEYIETLIGAALGALNKSRCQFLIFKDLPIDSPLLSARENDFCRSLLLALKSVGFVVLQGQGLAYVPIDFTSIEELLSRFSRARRKDFLRKLRVMPELSVETVKTGSPFFTDSAIEYLYNLYLNVYDGASVHFDKLSREFFYRVFRDGENSGIVFLYRLRGALIGFNLCFVHGRSLVDKYVGFMYPDSRKANLYFASWFENIGYCLRNGLKTFIAGWTDPQIKASLGASFTFTHHAVYCKSRALRLILKKAGRLFESEGKALEGITQPPKG
ncbi:MAG: GNAT family N-acetyltransferase [Nitrospirae bacterium]|nr:GNAT family N-acetyltransferase [Nitrospirota bacterium]